MTVDTTAPMTRRERARTDAGPALRGPVVLIAVAEVLRVALFLLLTVVRADPRVDPATGLFEPDPLQPVRHLLPYADLALFVVALVGVAVLLLRLGRNPARRGLAASVALGLAGLELLCGVLLTVDVMLFYDGGRLAELTLVHVLAPTTLFREHPLAPVVPIAGAFVVLLVVAVRVLVGRSSRVAVPAVRAAAHGQALGSSTQTNGLAIASLIVVFFSTPIGLVLGHVALSQIRRTGEGGRNLALTAVVLGWVSVGLAAIAVVVVVALGLLPTLTH